MFRHTFVSILLSNPNIGVATVAAEAGHAQLLEKQGKYYELWSLQQGIFRDKKRGSKPAAPVSAAKVVEDDDSLQDDPVLTDQDLVLGIRPEFLDIADQSPLEGEIYGAMPTGMESTIKVRVGEFLLTGVIFGSSLFTIGSQVPLTVDGDQIMLFDRKSGKCIISGSLEF